MVGWWMKCHQMQSWGHPAFKWHMDKCSKWHINENNIKLIDKLKKHYIIKKPQNRNTELLRDSAQIQVTHNENNTTLIDRRNIRYIFKKTQAGIECYQEIVHGSKRTFLINWSLHMYREIIHKKWKGHENVFPLMHREALEDKRVMKRERNFKRARLQIHFTIIMNAQNGGQIDKQIETCIPKSGVA